MKTNLLTAILSGLFMIGCMPSIPAPHENATLLYDRFHGKYEPVRSTSNEAIDVNLDGTASTNMLAEIPQLSRKYGNIIELRINKSQQFNAGPRLWYYQFWPDQHVGVITNDRNYEWKGESIDYDSELIVNYLSNPAGFSFSFSPDLKHIDLNPSQAEDSFRWVRPQSVTVNADYTIEAVTKRRLYTRAGAKDIVITNCLQAVHDGNVAAFLSFRICHSEERSISM